MSLRVVVNADDLGLHVAVRRAVDRLSVLGCLKSASVLANGPDVVAAARVEGVSLGAHLNILRGRPLSPPHEIRSLVGDDGLFLGRYAALFHRYATGALRLTEVELEWSRQVQRLLELGMRISHVDGEKHTHVWPTLLPVAASIAERFAVPFLRVPRERWRLNASWTGQARVLTLRWWLRAADSPFVRGTVRATDEVWGIGQKGEQLTAARFVADFSDPPEPTAAASRTVEIVCHPGDELPHDGDLPSQFGTMGVRAGWRPEYQNLADSAWIEAFSARGWKFASFEDLANDGR